MMHSFLLIGQSNMAGRGFREDVPPLENPRVSVLRMGRFQPFFHPVHNDRSTAGVCLAESFADLYAKEQDADVGLIPCADGGTCLDQWMPGGLLFDHACAMAELAARASVIRGILWHQGEADCKENLYPHYEEKLTVILTVLRERLGLADVPVLLGGLGDFLADCKLADCLKNYPHVNAALARTANTLPNAAFVSAKGLRANPDNLHFNSVSLREFGIRYYREFLKLDTPAAGGIPTAESGGQSEMEKL